MFRFGRLKMEASRESVKRVTAIGHGIAHAVRLASPRARDYDLPCLGVLSASSPARAKSPVLARGRAFFSVQ
jgi:hypothetical protein